MQSFRRSTAGAVRNIRVASRQQSRRYAHDAHDSTHQSPPHPSEESFGKGFYVTVALIPLSFALYKVSGQGSEQQPFLTRVIQSYDSWQQRWQDRNDLHTQAVEQAGADRNLFLNSVGSKHVELRYPEALNGGAPWNVPAGHQGDISKAIEKYEKEAYEEQARKLQALKDNNIRREKPLSYNPPANAANASGAGQLGAM